MTSVSIDEERAQKNHVHSLRFAMLALVFFCVFTELGTRSQNVASRVAAVESLAHRREFYLDNGPYFRLVERGGQKQYLLNDMVYNRRDEHFYSSKPPVLTLVLAGMVAALEAVGGRFEFTGTGLAFPLFLMTWLVVGVASAAAFYAFRRKAGERLGPLEADLAVILALGGTLFLSYSGTLNNHTVAAALVLLAFFLLGMAEGGAGVSGGRAAVAGFFMGMATVVDVAPGFVFSIVFGLYVLLHVRSWRTVLLFGLGSVPPLAAHCWVEYSIWGTILPVQMIQGAGKFEHSYWMAPVGPDTWVVPRWKYWALTLFSTRGLFVLSPILLLGVIGLVEDVRDGVRRGLLRARDEEAGRAWAALGLLLGIGSMVCYFSFRGPTSFGGSCFGFRWYIGFMPLLGWYAVRVFARRREDASLRRIFYLLGAISLMYALIGVRDPWELMENNPHPAVQALRVLRGF